MTYKRLRGRVFFYDAQMRRLQDLRAARELVEDDGLERRSLGLHI